MVTPRKSSPTLSGFLISYGVGGDQYFYDTFIGDDGAEFVRLASLVEPVRISVDDFVRLHRSLQVMKQKT